MPKSQKINDTVPLDTADEEWVTKFSGISMNNKSASHSASKAVLDSGNPYITLPASDWAEVQELFTKFHRSCIANELGLLDCECDAEKPKTVEL